MTGRDHLLVISACVLLIPRGHYRANTCWDMRQGSYVCMLTVQKPSGRTSIDGLHHRIDPACEASGCCSAVLLEKLLAHAAAEINALRCRAKGSSDQIVHSSFLSLSCRRLHIRTRPSACHLHASKMAIHSLAATGPILWFGRP